MPSIVSTAIGVMLVGGLIGYTGAGGVASVIQDQGWFATSGESREARAYMVALLSRESEGLSQLRPEQDVVSKALAAQSAQSNQTQARPLSLTYLGGGSAGRLSVQIYAVEVRASDGSQQLFPLALTLLGGKVVQTR